MKYLFTWVITLAICNLVVCQEYARNGMVVSTSDIASGVGVEVLQNGGNSIDAAVATAFALAVTHPSAGNIGGGGFIVYHPVEGDPTTIDFREKAPIAASPNMYLDENGEVIPEINRFTAKAIGVPGTVAGLFYAHQKYGSLSWSELVEPAIQLANGGFEMNWTLYEAAKYYERMKDKFPMMDEYFRDESYSIVEPGSTWYQPQLGYTLTQIRDNGKDGFYTGEVARKIAKFMEQNGGIITEEDLAAYEAIERKPVQGQFLDYDIYSMPPPSSGGTALIQMLNMMENVNFDSVEFNSKEYVHIVTETMRRAFADRAEHLGDPDFNENIPLNRLTDKKYAKLLFDGIDLEKASPSDSSKFGQLYGTGSNTTHFSVIDKDGNAVSLTYTLEHSFGSRLVAKELGFIFNNEMGDFNPMPGVTTSRGQIGTPPNLIAPEKRMLSSMTPTIVAKDGKPYLVIGSPGGRTIINTVFQTVLNVLAYEMNIERAIEVMKIHHQWLPDRMYFEKDLMSPDTRKSLEEMGHTLYPVEQLGVLMGIIWNEEEGRYEGHADARSGQGAAVGY